MRKGANKAVAKYLQRWAEPEAALAASLHGPFQAVVVVPARGESVRFMDGLLPALQQCPGSLLIVVVNGDRTCSDEVHSRNQQLLTDLHALGPCEEIAGWPQCSQVRLGAFHLLLIDRASEGQQLPPKTGVGLARKIGCDIGAQLWANGALRSPWLFNTDADVWLPANYFSHVQQASEAAGALLFEFSHEPGCNSAVDAATAEYEVWLRYCVLGLAWAGSPFAYHTLGSCLVLHAAAYMKVRGFPKRDAAEDFHLLAKIAKISPVQRLLGEPIRIKARRSQRTPVGTGARVEEMLGGQQLRFFNPLVFAVLQTVIGAMEHWAACAQQGEFERAFAMLPSALAEQTLRDLDKLGMQTAFDHALKQGGDARARLLHLHTWFDALKTVRLLHALQKNSLPPVDWHTALSQAPFLQALRESGAQQTPDALRRLERQNPALIGPTTL